MGSPTNSLTKPMGTTDWVLENGEYVRRPPVPLEVQEFAEARNMEVSHLNGQRILSRKCEKTFTPPPLKGCEVFVGRLPGDCYELELMPLMEQFGPIYKFRLMMDFLGTNRGYAFVQFFTAFQADLALKKLENFEIRPGHYLEIGKSIENCRVLLIGVPMYKTVKEIYDEIYPMFPRLQSVLIEDDQNTRVANPMEIGFAIAIYEDHSAAASARNKMIVNRLHLWGFRIHAEWASLETSPMPCYSAQVLRVTGIPRQIDNGRLNKIFNERSNWGVQHLKRRHEEAFVYFKTKYQTELAKFKTEELVIDGARIQVDWNRDDPNTIPVTENQQQDQVYEEGAFQNTTNSMVMMNQQTITTVTRQNTTFIPSQYEPCNDPRCYYNQPAPAQPLPGYQPYQGELFGHLPVFSVPPPPAQTYTQRATGVMQNVLQQLGSSFHAFNLH